MKRSFGIDLIRTLSILVVIFRHYRVTDGYNFGIYAIEFLFVISGYLIGQILLTEFHEAGTPNMKVVGRFMARRWFRILPMYYFALLLKFIIVHDIGWNILYYVFFLQNHFYGIDFYPVTWTLVIDEWFYLGTPFLLYGFVKMFGWDKKKLLLMLVGVIVLINLGRMFWVWKTNAGYESLVGNVPFRQDTLLIGVLGAFIKINYKSIFDWFNRRGPFWISMIGFLAFVVLIGYIQRDDVTNMNQYFWTRTIAFSFVALLITMTMPYLENKVHGFSSPKMNWLNFIISYGSKLSYALYLYHLEVLGACRYLWPELDKQLWIRNSLCFTVSLVISVLLYNFLEKQFLILREKYYPSLKPNTT